METVDPNEKQQQRSGVRIGCAGWTLARRFETLFPGDGSHLARYARTFTAVELNSTFHRSHRPATYSRWVETVGPDFRFATKIPKEISHRLKLENAADALDRYLAEVLSLGAKMGPLLLQLPPSFAYDRAVVAPFIELLRSRFDGDVVYEPRHPSWFADPVDELLQEHRIARVAADPARVVEASRPGGWGGLVYYRWHGSPRIYYSEYAEERLADLATEIGRHEARGVPVWVIFDNTASGAAAGDAQTLQSLLSSPA